MSNWIYINTLDNKARYILGEKGTCKLICIGINPSTAEPNNLDNTLTSVRNRAKYFDYDSWIMINVYPQRATDPNNLDMALNESYHKRNMEEIEKLFSDATVDIWAAWGTLIKKRPYLMQCLKDIVKVTKKYPTKWFTVGKTSKDNHPHHPLYLKKDLPLDIFDIDTYINAQK